MDIYREEYFPSNSSADSHDSEISQGCLSVALTVNGTGFQLAQLLISTKALDEFFSLL